MNRKASSIEFGLLLRQSRIGARLSKTDTGFSSRIINLWENGSQLPSRNNILRLIRSLFLDDETANRLLMLAGCEKLSEGDREVLAKRLIQLKLPLNLSEPFEAYMKKVEPIADLDLIKGSVKTQTTVTFAPDGNTSQMAELQIQLRDLHNTTASLRTKIEEISQVGTFGQNTVILDQFQELRETISKMQTTSQSLTAPVVLPTPEDMEVKLVSSTSLERLEEYRSEESKWGTWLGVFVGAIIGILINLATGGQLTQSALILISTFVLLSILTGWTEYSFKERAHRLKERIMGNQSKTNKTQ